MQIRFPGRPRLRKEQAEVISWLRSPEGEAWSECRIEPLERQREDSGVFADIRFPGYSAAPVTARWPEPHYCHDLDAGYANGDW